MPQIPAASDPGAGDSEALELPASFPRASMLTRIANLCTRQSGLAILALLAVAMTLVKVREGTVATLAIASAAFALAAVEIGRASCRERVYVLV